MFVLSKNPYKNPFTTETAYYNRISMSKNVAAMLVLVFLTASCIIAAKPAGASENSWIARPPMPNKNSGLGVAVVNGKIYAIGPEGTNEEYDPATLTWTTKASIPTPRSASGIAVYQNKIYVIGGISGSDPTTGLPILCSFNEVYYPLTDTLETRKPMPTKRCELSANMVNGKIYLIGGRTGGQYSTVCLNEVYDPETNSWSTKAPMPYPVVEYASAVVDGKIYVLGGQDEFHDPMNIDLTQIYDPETDTWSFGAPMPTVVTQAAAGATSGVLAPKRIYVIGGLPDKSMIATNINQVYSPESDSWTLGASMPTSRSLLAVGVVNDTLYALGGVSMANIQGTAYAANELYIPFGYEGPLPPYWYPPPSPSPSPTTSPTPSPSPSPMPTASPSVTPTPSQEPSSTPKPQQPEPFPTSLVIAASGTAVAVVGVGLLVYFKKRKS
jgi:N-acetylneuraminic acid mutarotase